MILNIRHRGLDRLYQGGSARGLEKALVPRILRILQLLDVVTDPAEVQAAATPGQRFHALAGDYVGYYSMSVSGNWRIVFRFVGSDVTDVDLVDYH